MTTRRTLRHAEDIIALSERLSQLPQVNRFDQADHHEASTLAHAFADLEESFTKFLNELLPRLARKGSGEDTIPDVLLEIGEEFRHILYHLRDPKFYGYLHDVDTQSEAR